MRTLWMWIASATAIGLCQRVQAKSDLLPSDNIPSGTKEATKPSLEAHNVPANFSAVFTCKHPDATNKTVSWLHNMAKIMDTTQDKKTRYNVTTEPGTSTFTIAHVQVEDQGSVMCQVQSGAGLVENTVTFKVSQFEIKVNQQDVTGETTYVPDRTTGVTYTCAIKYVPKNAHLSWFHNGTELNATTCKNRKCIIENDNVPADVKKAVVYYPAVKSAPLMACSATGCAELGVR
ncbi:uncharacterized protein LOC129599105 [Paramacrobiotus metropolitanus]|uniref:uncharacterized protein LOC129599105 n=1 Tax=Paramacrobiotus metropolitanus TaxID=2943436 RepID=UPI0024457352|nr:uncharacterized protein LOC129599105 [Paramacrobiotus metropolitanus]